MFCTKRGIDETALIGQLQECINEYKKYEEIVQKYEKEFTRIPANIRRTKCTWNGEEQCIWYFNNEPASFDVVDMNVMSDGELNFPSRVYMDSDGNTNVEWDNLMISEGREKMMDEIARLKKGDV